MQRWDESPQKLRDEVEMDRTIEDEEKYLRYLISWAVGWIESENRIPGQQVEENEGSPDASIWLSLHKAARWNGIHICRDDRKL